MKRKLSNDLCKRFFPQTTKLNISQILTQHTPPNVQFQRRAQNPKAQLVKKRPITMQAGRMLEKFFFNIQNLR